LVERENRRMEFHAKLAGAELPDEPKKTDKQADTGNNLADRLRKRKQEKLEQEAKKGGGKKPAEFSHGVGYQVIGG
jgi:hypothetical protein